MPYHPAEARILLRERKAFVKRNTPCTIQRTLPIKEKLSPVSLGVDAGSRHIGLSATTEKENLQASEIGTRTDVSALLSTRRHCRRERLHRKTRSRATLRQSDSQQEQGRLAPSVENILAAPVSRIEDVLKLLPPQGASSKRLPLTSSSSGIPGSRVSSISRGNSSASETRVSTCSAVTSTCVSTAMAQAGIRYSRSIIWSADAQVVTPQQSHDSVQNLSRCTASGHDRTQGKARSVFQGRSRHEHHEMDCPCEAEGCSQGA